MSAKVRCWKSFLCVGGPHRMLWSLPLFAVCSFILLFVLYLVVLWHCCSVFIQSCSIQPLCLHTGLDLHRSNMIENLVHTVSQEKDKASIIGGFSSCFLDAARTEWVDSPGLRFVYVEGWNFVGAFCHFDVVTTAWLVKVRWSQSLCGRFFLSHFRIILGYFFGCILND